MNTYSKFVPNVFLAKCTEEHQKGETVTLETKYGNNHECIIFNLMGKKDGFFYYSIVRADGFNVQEWAKRKADRLINASINAENKSTQYFERSNDAVKGIVFGQPILVGHHSEKRHRADLDKSWNAMGKSVEMSKKAEEYESRAEYWSKKANTINLSMPESLDFYEFELEKAKAKHEGLKNGTIERSHSFSLTYAKKELNDIEAKYKLALRLWGDVVPV
jgi:hypothetical protein